MSAKVVLPDFSLPGQGPHLAVRALWAAGGLVVVSTLMLGGALWHRQAVDTAAHAAAAQARMAAAQPAQSVAAAPAPSVPAAAAAPAPVAAAGAVEQPSAAPVSAPAARSAAVRSHARHRTFGARHAARSMKGRTLARGGVTDKGSKKSGAKKDDDIDRLLRQFK